MADPVQTDPAALPSAPSDDLWTADSERSGDGAIAVERETADPAQVDLVADPASVSPADRDDKGHFKPKGSGKPRNDPQARVQQATAKEAAAKEEARLATERGDRLERELAEARRAPRADAAPAQEDHSIGFRFPKFDAWLETHPEQDWDDYHDAKLEARDAWKDARQADAQALESFGTRVSAAGTKYPDFDQVARRSDVTISGAMKEAILASEHGPDIAYYLGSHPEVSAQLTDKTKSLGRDAVGLVRDHLESLVTAGAAPSPDSASPVRPSAAKPPINRVGGTANATPLDPDDLDFGPEYIRLENAREKKRQEASRW